MTPDKPREEATPWQSGSGVGPLGPGERLQCTAKSKRSGKRCEAYPVHGAKVCVMHGGKAKQVKAAAARRLAAEKVAEDVKDALAFESLDPVTDPLEALARLADEALAMKEALAARVNDLKSIRYSSHGSGTEQLRAEVALYERALDRSAKFLDLLVKSGFEERRVAIGEQQGQMVASVLRVVLSRMLDGVISVDGVAADPETSAAVRQRWQELVPIVVPEELRKISAGTVPGQVVRR